MSDLHCFVVPAYGRSPHLAACLASLQRQTRPSPVVVSTTTPYDGLSALVAAYGARLVVHEGKAGIGSDWNRALSSVRAHWVTIAHQDDLYLPEFASRTIAMVETWPEATLMFTGYAELLDDAQQPASAMLMIKRILLEGGFLGRSAISSARARTRLLRFGCPIPCPAVTLRAEAADRLFREDLKVNLDWDAWLRLASMPGVFGYCREVLMLHRIHEASETSEGVRGGVRAREDRMMFDRLWPRPLAAVLARVYALSYHAGRA